MLEILSEIVKKIIEFISEFSLQQLYYVFCYKNNLKKLKNQVEDLEGQRDRIQHLVNAAKRNGKTIFPDVLKWLEEVEKITGEAEQLQGNADHARAGCCPNFLLQHEFGWKAEAEATSVGDCKKKGEKFRSVTYDPPSEPDFKAITVPNIIGIEILESRMSTMNDIMQAITVPNISMVGVYGLEGVGKTTLMYQVAEKAKLDKSFDAVIMTSVNQTPNIRSIQGGIAEQLDLKFEKETSFDRASCLRDRIKQEKIILIILDGIREMFDMNEVGIPLGDHKGCKVLMTSRTQEVLNKMGSQKNFRLEPLDKSETLKLFQGIVGGVVNSDSFVQHIATHVPNRCAGLPVLIVAVSKELEKIKIEGKSSFNWLTTINQDLQEIYRSAFELCSNGLEGKDVKELFLLCGLLGSNSISNLLNYGMGLGIFKDVNTVEDARNRLLSTIDKLKASCLLLEDDKSTTHIKMHDKVREVAISIASRDEPVFKFQGSSDPIEWPTEKYSKIILPTCHIHKFPEKVDNPKLKLLILNNVKAKNQSMEIPDSFFEGLTNLEVLDLTCMNVSSLPTSLSSLTKLKTLCLERCTLGSMAALEALKNIEILGLLKSSITMLPTEIGQLTSLRMLNLTSSRIEFIPPNIISSLINLEEFYAGDTCINWEAENSTRQNKNANIAELSQLPRLIALNIQIQDASVLPQDDLFFEKLKRYKIFIGDLWTWSEIYEDLNFLKLKLSNSSHLGQGVRSLFERVESLHLDEIKGISNLLYQLNFEGFLQLKSLHIQNNDEIRHIANSLECIQPYNAFPNLEALNLHKLSKIEKICHGPLTSTSFQKLKVIKVKKCDQLKSLISSSMVRGLSQLLEIEVSECNFMKEIVAAENLIPDNNEITIMIEFHQLHSLTLQRLPALIEFYSDEVSSSESKPLFNYKVLLPNLETLDINGANKLNEIWDWQVQQLDGSLFKNLKTLRVSDCSGISILLPFDVLKFLYNLGELEVYDCHSLEVIFDLEGARKGEIHAGGKPLPLRVLILRNLPKLKHVWNKDPQGILDFRCLSKIHAWRCDNLKCLIPFSVAKLQNKLEDLSIIECNELETIVEEKEDGVNVSLSFVLSQVTSLTLQCLPKLTTFPHEHIPQIGQN